MKAVYAGTPEPLANLYFRSRKENVKQGHTYITAEHTFKYAKDELAMRRFFYENDIPLIQDSSDRGELREELRELPEGIFLAIQYDSSYEYDCDCDCAEKGKVCTCREEYYRHIEANGCYGYTVGMHKGNGEYVHLDSCWGIVPDWTESAERACLVAGAGYSIMEHFDKWQTERAREIESAYFTPEQIAFTC